MVIEERSLESILFHSILAFILMFTSASPISFLYLRITLTLHLSFSEITLLESTTLPFTKTSFTPYEITSH